ncbi:MAG: hypothetical protein ACRDIX_02540 [Actinomycetota bacterium]
MTLEPERIPPRPPIFILEGHDLGIFDDVERAQLQLEPIDVKDGIYEGYDAQGRRLRIWTDGKGTFIELEEEQPSDVSRFESELRADLIRLGEDRAAEADCDLPCLVEISGRHAELDRGSLGRAAEELQERYRSAFGERGGDLQVSAAKASDLGTRTKSWELYAEIEWEASRIHEHVHAEIARRPWFSQRWKRLRSLRGAVGVIETKLTEWLQKGP